MWARFTRDRFGAKRAESMKLRTHAQTAGVSLTAQQPYNNVVRVALQAMAAVLGGTQSLHTNSLDETYALPTEESVMIALRTQQVIAHESGVANTVDPLGGSYFVEWMTDKLEAEATDWDHKSDEQMHQHHRWAQSTTVLQVCIALAAIALLTKKRWLEYAMFAAGAAGLVVGALAALHI